jgi:hypothetical protein
MQNFGKIKNTFTEILIENIGLGNNPHKSLFSKYVKLINESEILKTQFLVYSNIETMVKGDPLIMNLSITENLRLLEKFTIKDIINENQKLLKLSNIIKENIDKPYDTKLTELHESISKIICTKRTPNNIKLISESINNIVKYVQDNKPMETINEVELPNSMLTSLLVDKYNEKYSNISESDRKIIKTLINSTDSQKEEVYSDTIRECIDLVNSKLVESDSDLDAKDKLLRVKDKLLDYKKNNENFIENISKLITLKNGLIE